MGDDKLLPITRWLGRVILPVLLAAFVMLFFLPTRTAQLWAWPVAPPVNATTMGAGYLAGAYFFARVAVARRWHTVAWGFPAVTVFTTALLAATLLHWAQFSHGHVSFWAWLALYVVTPPLLPLVWLRNRRRDTGGHAEGGLAVPRPLRAVVATAGGLLLISAAAALLFPPLAVAVWPWPLTPLTARTLASFASFPACALLTFAWEDRWTALARPVEAATLGLALTAAGVLLHLDDLTASAPAVAAYLAVLLGGVALLTLLLVRQHRVTRAAAAAA